MRHKPLLALFMAAALAAVALGVSANTPVSNDTPAPAAASHGTLPALAPEARESFIEQSIGALLTRNQYDHRPLDNSLSPEIFDLYLKDLDQNRSYFLQSDVDGFAAYRGVLADAIRNGDLKPAFAIYNVYLQRVEQRIQFALQQLDHEPDFTVKESYIFDREKSPWAQNGAELDDIWRKRVKNDVIGLMLAGKTWAQAADVLRKRYETFDTRARQVKPEDVFTQFMNAYAHSLDPHTDYLSPDQSQEFQIRMSLKLQGIGASLVTDGEYTRVDSILPGGPASRDKQLHPDDRITAVGQGVQGEMEDVVGWRLDDVVAKIRGTPGSIVRLQILPAGAAPGSPEKMIQYTRDTIKLEAQAAHKKTVTVDRGKHSYKIGVITVPGFYEDFNGRKDGDKDYNSTTRDVRRLLGELKTEHVDGVVIDLRNNGGGSLLEATELTGLFVPEGPAVQIRYPDGRVEVDDDDTDGGVAYTGPLAVLVNRFTASASEIFAAAIQDYHRGLVVGATTYGKGTVQTLKDLNPYVPGDEDAGQLKFTINKYYRVNGSSTQTKGVTPDITLPSPVDPKEFGESTEPTALPWDEISPAEFTALHSPLPLSVPRLTDLHQQRAAKDTAWQLYMSNLKEFEQERSETSVSLVLSEREKQRAEDDKQRLAEMNAWRKLKNLPAAATLEDALKTGKGAATGSSTDDAAEAAAEELQPDVLLDETAEIVTDIDKLGLDAPAPSSVAVSH